MADILSQGEFWLPPEFLMDEQNAKKKNLNTVFGPNFGSPAVVPYDLDSFGSSSVTSPVESMVGSPETESDEEDLLAGLTSQLGRTTLQDKTCRIPSASQNLATPLLLSLSPQSTLAGVGSWNGRSAAFRNGSPNCPSQAPPTTPLGVDVSLDLIYGVAGQVARLKMCGEAPPGSRGNLGHPESLCSAHLPPPAAKSRHLGLYGDHFLSQNLLFADNVQYTRQHDQAQKQQYSSIWGRPSRDSYFSQQQVMVQNRGRGERVLGFGGLRAENGGRCGHELGMPRSAWVQPQQGSNLQLQRGGSGVRAVILGESGAKECAGTGVFLPRRYGNTPEPRKKSGNCSTALLPARVMQVLSTNLDDIRAQPHFNGSFAPDCDVLMARRNASLMQQRRGSRPEVPLSHELWLPQEWTY